MMPPKPKEVLEHHLFVNILKIDGDGITSFKDKGGVWNYINLLALSYNDITNKLHKFNCTTLAVWRYVIDWKIYADCTNPIYVDIMGIPFDLWEMVKFTLLRIKHELSQASITSSSPTVTADTVTSSQIKATNFLKYCNVNLIDKSQIIIFMKKL